MISVKGTSLFTEISCLRLAVDVLFMLSNTSVDIRDFFFLITIVNFMVPKAEEMYLLFAQDGCHFYAAKSWSWRNVLINWPGWLSFWCCQELKKCIYYLLKMDVIFMLPRAKEMYLSIDLDGCHFYAAKNWRNVFIFCSAAKSWRHVFIICSLSFLCCLDLKTRIYYLLRMVVILMLPRAEETSYLFRMVVIFKLSNVFFW